MASIIPLPILSLYTADRLEQLVCGIPDISVNLLKQVARYDSQFHLYLYTKLAFTQSFIEISLLTHQHLCIKTSRVVAICGDICLSTYWHRQSVEHYHMYTVATDFFLILSHVCLTGCADTGRQRRTTASSAGSGRCWSHSPTPRGFCSCGLYAAGHDFRLTSPTWDKGCRSYAWIRLLFIFHTYMQIIHT